MFSFFGGGAIQKEESQTENYVKNISHQQINQSMGGEVKVREAVDRSGFADVSQAALTRQTNLETKLSNYFSDSNNEVIEFDPSSENHLVEHTWKLMKEYCLKKNWQIRRIKATEKEISKCHVKGSRFWLYIATNIEILNLTIANRIPIGTYSRNTSSLAATISSFENKEEGTSSVSSNKTKATRVTKASKSAKSSVDKIPRKPSAYINFCRVMRSNIKDANPTASFGQIGALCGSEWNKLPQEEKKKYAEIEIFTKEGKSETSSIITEAESKEEEKVEVNSVETKEKTIEENIPIPMEVKQSE
jgi:hypothetical protein